MEQSPKSDKARLISRMAKMGQPMLPNMSGAMPAHPDSEDEPVGGERKSVRVVVHSCVCVCVYVCECVHVCLDMFMNLFACVCTYGLLCVCVCVCMCMSLHVCVCV